MKIKSIHLRNLKSFKDVVSLKFSTSDDDPVSLIYGQNGMGKTTILEAISLLGHLPTMSQFVLPEAGTPGKMQNSEFLIAYNAQLPTGAAKAKGWDFPRTDLDFVFSSAKDLFDLLADKTDEQEIVRLLNGTAFNSRSQKAMIRFEVDFGKGSLSKFFVLFRGKQESGDSISITKSLGRNSFDDLQMNHAYTLIYWAEDEALVEYLKHTLSITPYMVKEDGKNRTIHFSPPNISLGGTFYLNTDLNDFGRGRDVRESVKNLDDDFRKEYCERLRIITAADGSDGKLDEDKRIQLEDCLNKILRPSRFHRFMGRLRKFIPILPDKSDDSRKRTKLVECGVLGNGKSSIKIQRPSDDEPVSLDYLSAGENECFFIFLYLLGANIQNSICLLDEPDLHLSQTSKGPFYEKLYEILKRHKCQVIISTHTGFANTDPDQTSLYQIRKIAIDKKKFSYETTYTPKFGVELALEYLRTAFRGLGFGLPLVLILTVWAGLSFLSDINSAYSNFRLENLRTPTERGSKPRVLDTLILSRDSTVLATIESGSSDSLVKLLRDARILDSAGNLSLENARTFAREREILDEHGKFLEQIVWSFLFVLGFFCLYKFIRRAPKVEADKPQDPPT